MRNLGSNGQKSRVQNVLILLVESGLVYLGIQVSHFVSCLLICARKFSPFRQIVFLVLAAQGISLNFNALVFEAVYFSFSVSAGKTEDFHYA